MSEARAHNALSPDPAVVSAMSDQELLKTIWSIESEYGMSPDAFDHRRHLSRSELEQVFRLVRCRAALRCREQVGQTA